METVTNKAETFSLRGSELERVELCPGSHAAQLRIKGKDSKASDSGQRIHDGLESVCNFAALSTAETISAACEAYATKNDLEKRESFVLSWFAGIVQKITQERGGAVKIIKEVEQKLDLSEKVGFPAIVTGSPDLIIETVGGRDVWEYKTGRLGQCTAEKHIQGQLYTVFSMKLEPSIDASTLHVLAAGNDRGEQHTFCTYADEGAAFIVDRVCEILRKAHDASAERIPSEHACRYCRASGTLACPESCKMVDKFSANVVKMSDPVAIFGALTPDQRSATLARALQVNAILEKIIAAAKEGLTINPEYLPGYEITPATQARSIPDASLAFKRLALALPITPKMFSEIAKVGIGDVEKLATASMVEVAKTKGEKPPTAKEAKTRIAEILGDAIETKDRAGSLKAI